MEIANKKVIVAGLGETGYDTALFLAGRGAKVFVTESGNSENIRKKASFLAGKGIRTETGGHTEKFISGARMLIPSPGISEESLPLDFARRNNIEVLSEIELAYIFSPSKKIVAITGTNGKTTTASILGLIFRKAKLPSTVCGNIGKTFIGEIDNIGKETFVVLEASSFQLERIRSFRPFVGCLLNIDQDHMDRHLSFTRYMEAKKNLFINQEESDRAVVNYDNACSKEIGGSLKAKTFFFSQEEALGEGAYIEGNKIVASTGRDKKVFITDRFKIKGRGNNENIMASILAGMICRADTGAIQDALDEFKPLAHRFEKVAEVNGVSFINDSKATNPHSVINALKSIEPGRQAVLIMGGQNKNTSFGQLVPFIKKSVRCLILMGEAKELIAKETESAGKPLIFACSMKEAVRKGAEMAERGDALLLSPGCASFDMFANYKERGDAFKKEVGFLL